MNSRNRKAGQWVLAAWVLVMGMLVVGGLLSEFGSDSEEPADDMSPVAVAAAVPSAPYEPATDTRYAVGGAFRIREGVVELADAAGQIDVSSDTNGVPVLTVDVFPLRKTPAAPGGGTP